MAQGEPIRRFASEIPDKLYFRIGDVARLCEVPAYVLRFWESEFTQLRPNKGGTGQRLFRKRDVETALRIKRLLYDEGYTIPGARQILKSESRAKEPQLALTLAGALPADTRGRLEALRSDLTALADLLSANQTRSLKTLPATSRSARPKKQANSQLDITSIEKDRVLLFEAPTPAPIRPGQGVPTDIDPDSTSRSNSEEI